MAITGDKQFTIGATGAPPKGEVTVAGHADGTFVAAWSVQTAHDSDEFFEPSYDVFARAYSGETALGVRHRVNTRAYDNQLQAQAAALPDGSYVVTYLSAYDPGNFNATQLLDGQGKPVGPEHFVLHTDDIHNPDVSLRPDGSFVTVTPGFVENDPNISDRGYGQEYGADGSPVGDRFLFGDPGIDRSVGVSALSGGGALLLWAGIDPNYYSQNPGDGSPPPVLGIYGQTRSATGALGPVFLIAPEAPNAADMSGGGGDFGGVDPNVSGQLLPDGRIAVTWLGDPTPDDVLFTGQVRLAIVDPATGTASATIVVDPAGADQQIKPELAVLDNGHIVVVWQDDTGVDGSGSGILAREFDANGTPLGASFVVEQTTAGDQTAPSVAAIGSGRFVIAWSDGSDIEARIFSNGDTPPPQTSPLFTRAGTIDLSPSENQVVTSGAGPNSVYVDIGAISGADRVIGFGHDDVLLTSSPLHDGNGDGVVTFGRNGLLDLDGPGGAGDTIRMDGVKALRFLGTSNGLSVYADAAVRPKGAVEGTLAAETLSGGAGPTVFFRDTALGTSFGDDTLRFGQSDLFVTTTKLADRNADGIVSFGANGRLDVGPDQLTFQSADAHAVPAALEFDGVVQHGGVSYFVYSAPGSAAGTAQLHFS